MRILEGAHPPRVMATRMHELAEGCRKVSLCFVFSPTNPVAQMTYVLPTRIRPDLVQSRCLSDRARLMPRDDLMVVCTWRACTRVVCRVSEQKSGTWLSFSLKHAMEWGISRGPQAIRFSLVSATRRTRSRGEARGWEGQAVLQRSTRAGKQEWMDAETRKKKKRTDRPFTSAHWHAIPKKDFLGRAKTKKKYFPYAVSVVVGSRERHSRGNCSRRSENLRQPF